jgi:hypothetical protein
MFIGSTNEHALYAFVSIPQHTSAYVIQASPSAIKQNAPSPSHSLKLVSCVTREQRCSHSRMSRTRRLLRTVLWLSRPSPRAHEFPLCHDHRGSRDPSAGSVAKVGLAIGNQNHLRLRTVQKETFGKRVRDVMRLIMRDKVLCTKFVNKVCHPATQRRDD